MHPHSDVALKWKRIYRDDWRRMEETGHCPPQLYADVLLWRSQLPLENQAAEGIASQIQRMAKLAPRATIQRISDT